MGKNFKWYIFGVVLAIPAYFGIKSLYKQNKKSDMSIQTMPSTTGSDMLSVKVIVVEPQSLQENISISGNILSDEQVNLCFETSGKITEILFKEGGNVVKGELLAKINDAPLQAQLRKLEAQLKLNKDRVFRQSILLQKEAVSREALQEAESNLAKLEAEIDEIKAKIAQTELRAPFDGVIGLRYVSTGAYASPSSTIATLASNSRLKVEFSVSERYAGSLQIGTPILFSVVGDNVQREATIYATDSKVDPEIGTYTARAIYDNSDGELVPGRYVTVTLTTKIFDQALSVPSEAIISEMGIDKVFLYKNGLSQPVEIKKGLRTDSHVQVLHGISHGDTVITSGILQLRTGLKVQIR